MARIHFNNLSTEEKYQLLHSVCPEDFMDDNRPVFIPTPGQIAHCDFDNLPYVYQVALEEIL